MNILFQYIGMGISILGFVFGIGLFFEKIIFNRKKKKYFKF